MISTAYRTNTKVITNDLSLSQLEYMQIEKELMNRNLSPRHFANRVKNTEGTVSNVYHHINGTYYMIAHPVTDKLSGLAYFSLAFYTEWEISLPSNSLITWLEKR